MEYLAERQVAALGSDGNSDTAPSVVDGVAFPVHVLAINAMGLHLLDYLQFDDLLPVCQAAGRWSFLASSRRSGCPGDRLPDQPDRQTVRRRAADAAGDHRNAKTIYRVAT